MATTLDRLDGGDPRARARELVERVEGAADAAEREARLPEDVARAMALVGLHRIAAPRRVGGGECEPREQLETIETISAADGAAGWNLMIGIEVAGFLGASLPEEVAAKVFSDPSLIVAGALNPMGVAVPVPGGFRVSGQWPFASGCHNAHYFWGQCHVRDESGQPFDDGRPALREALVSRDDFEILDTWHVSGLRGSGSHDVKVVDVFVPEEHMTAVLFTPPRETGTLFRLPPFSRLAYNKVGVSTGIARAAIDHFAEFGARHIRRFGSAPLRERSDVQRNVAEAETTLRSARAFVLEAIDELWQVVDAGDEPSHRSRALVHLACSNAAASAARAVDLVCEVAGTASNSNSNPLSRRQRDVRVIPQHITVSPQWNDAAARILLGMESDSFLF
jgi:alkylation response protein AidB-like acyl-CoA dehydrogenase